MPDTESRIRITAVNATQRAFGEIKRSMQEVEGSASALRNAMLGLGAGLSFGGLVAFAKSGIDAANALDDLSQRVGVSVESLSQFQFAAKMSDVSSEQLASGLMRLARAAAEAQGGAGETAEAFRALGVSVTNSSGQLKSTENLLLDVAEQFAGIEDGAGKTALAMRLFGRSGAELIPLLNQGRTGFESLRREAEELGLVISSQTAKAAAEFNDNLDRLTSASEKLKIQLANELLPSLNRFVNELLEGNRISGGFIESLRLFGTVNPFKTLGDNIRGTREELEKLEAARKRIAASNSDTRSVDQAIDAERKRLEFLKFQQRQAALALPGGDTPGERARFGGGVTGGRPAPSLAGGGASNRERDGGFQNALRQIEQEAQKLQELTRFEEVLADVQSGRYGQLNEAQRNQLLNAAAVVDLAREEARVQREAQAAVEAANREQANRERSEGERLGRLAQQYRDALDPLEKFRQQLREIDELVARGLLGDDEARELRVKIQVEMEDATLEVDRFKDKVTEAQDASRELGLTMSSALGRIITEGGKAKDVMRALLQDIAQIILRRQVLEPVANNIGSAITSALPSFDGGGFTGAGSRSGGLDGRGGFLAMLHPNETVLDHSRGASGSGVVQQTINFSANTPAAVRDAVFALAPQLTAASVAAVRAERNRSGDRR
jgi:hypothetical protein